MAWVRWNYCWLFSLSWDFDSIEYRVNTTLEFSPRKHFDFSHESNQCFSIKCQSTNWTGIHLAWSWTFLQLLSKFICTPSPRFRAIAHEINVWMCVFLSSFFTENEQGPSTVKCDKQKKNFIYRLAIVPITSYRLLASSVGHSSLRTWIAYSILFQSIQTCAFETWECFTIE